MLHRSRPVYRKQFDDADFQRDKFDRNMRIGKVFDRSAKALGTPTNSATRSTRSTLHF